MAVFAQVKTRREYLSGCGVVPADDDDGVALRRFIMARRPGAAQERPSSPSAVGRARLDCGGDGRPRVPRPVDPVIALGIAAWSAWEGRQAGEGMTAANRLSRALYLSVS
jgi:hypothetical protein